MDARWEYLKLDLFDVRQAAAAMFLRRCPFLVEFGGWETPLSRLTPKNVYQFKSGMNVCGSFGFVALGLDPDPETDWPRVQDLFNRSMIAVLEYAEGYGPGAAAVERLHKGGNKTLKWQVRFDLSDNTLPKTDGYTPQLIRRLSVYE